MQPRGQFGPVALTSVVPSKVVLADVASRDRLKATCALTRRAGMTRAPHPAARRTTDEAIGHHDTHLSPPRDLWQTETSLLVDLSRRTTSRRPGRRQTGCWRGYVMTATESAALLEGVERIKLLFLADVVGARRLRQTRWRHGWYYGAAWGSARKGLQLRISQFKDFGFGAFRKPVEHVLPQERVIGHMAEATAQSRGGRRRAEAP
jgi:hypothetical protein